MHIRIGPDMRLYVDIEGNGLIPDGTVMHEKPTPVLRHGGPGFDHSEFKALFAGTSRAACAGSDF